MSLSNPLNLVLITAILYLVFRIVFPSHPNTPATLPDTYNEAVYNWMPAKHAEVLCYREYTAPELAKLDGKDGGRICLAIMRVGRDGKVAKGLERTVFDVSNGKSFYGPGEPNFLCPLVFWFIQRHPIQEREQRSVLPKLSLTHRRRDVRQLRGSRRIQRHGEAVLRRG
jgi:hypothetical protein